MRGALGCAGVALAGYGVWLLVGSEHGTDLLAVCVWLAAGVVLHDAVLAPTALALGWASGRLLPRAAAAGAAVALVVLGPLTLIAVPVVARSAEDPANPTLLPRNYPLGWLELAAGVVVLAVGVTIAVLRSGRGDTRRTSGTDPRGR